MYQATPEASSPADAERRLSEKRRILALAESLSGVGHWRYTLKTREIYWSDEVYRIHGVSRDDGELTCDQIKAFYPETGDHSLAHLISTAIREGGYDAELTLKRASGETREIIVKAVAERDDQGKVLSLIGVFQDLTDQRAALREAQKSESRFKLLADNSADVITRIRMDGGSGYISPSIKGLIGYDPIEMRGRPAQAFVYPPDQSKLLATFADLASGQDQATLELRAQHKDGHPVWIETRFRLLRDEKGQPREMVAVIRDISDRKQLEAQTLAARDEAREQARRAERAEGLAGLGHWRVDAVTGEISWSETMYELFGLKLNSRVTMDILAKLSHSADGPALAERLALAKRGVASPDRTLLRIFRSDGELRYLMTRVDAERAPNGDVLAVIGATMDITELKRAEMAMEDSEARYRQLAESAHDMILQLDLAGRLTYMSPSVAPKTGYAATELIGLMATDLMHPDDTAAVKAALEDQRASRGKTPTRTLEYRIKTKGGRELWLEGRPTVVFDHRTGLMSGFTDVVRDITERKALETQLRAARAEAEAAAAVKSEFLANMSHELRTPLTSIVGFTGLAAAHPHLPEDVRGYIDRVETASLALLSAVNDILDFSKLEAGQAVIRPEPTELRRLCSGALDLFTHQAAAKGLDLRLDFHPAPATCVSLDPDRLRQVLINLIGNAVKFTDMGSVVVDVSHHDDQLAVAVSDTGCGVSAEDVEKLFQRFSQVDGSLTRLHGGTGLGLAICKGLVDAMGGQIGVVSERGEGSRFWFSLPAPLVMVPTLAQSKEEDVVQGFAALRILVADDHPANREIARLFLSGVGAHVIEAPDGEIAVDLAATQKFDVILMDVRMPRLDGPSALKRIREGGGLNAATPILAYTADADAMDSGKLLQRGFNDVVAKPIDPSALLAAVAQAAEAGITPEL